MLYVQRLCQYSETSPNRSVGSMVDHDDSTVAQDSVFNNFTNHIPPDESLVRPSQLRACVKRTIRPDIDVTRSTQRSKSFSEHRLLPSDNVPRTRRTLIGRSGEDMDGAAGRRRSASKTGATIENRRRGDQSDLLSRRTAAENGASWPLDHKDVSKNTSLYSACVVHSSCTAVDTNHSRRNTVCSNRSLGLTTGVAPVVGPSNRYSHTAQTDWQICLYN